MGFGATLTREVRCQAPSHPHVCETFSGIGHEWGPTSTVWTQTVPCHDKNGLPMGLSAFVLSPNDDPGMAHSHPKFGRCTQTVAISPAIRLTLGRPTTVGGPPPPPPPPPPTKGTIAGNEIYHWEKKSDRAILGTQIFGSQTPPLLCSNVSLAALPSVRVFLSVCPTLRGGGGGCQNFWVDGFPTPPPQGRVSAKCTGRGILPVVRHFPMLVGWMGGWEGVQ